jgi:hypothetical protein
MKIGLFGNMNNMLYQVARYLSDEGHQCTLHLLEEFDHFLPSADTYIEDTRVAIKQLDWTKGNFDNLLPSELVNVIQGYDFYIGTDIAPAVFFKAGYYLDIFVPHGSDLYEYPFPPFNNKVPQLWELKNYFLGKYQFQGIRASTCVSMDPSEDVFEVPLNKIKSEPYNRIMTSPFLYFHQYKNGYELQSNSIQDFKLLREKYHLIVWQHISQDWSDRGYYKINKGNDILIKGFSEYLSASNYKESALLILVEYGTDIEKSKDYILELGIELNVKWVPKMLRKDIMAALSQVDFGVGELGIRRWYSYCSIFEYMLAGLPTIHHRDDDFYGSKDFDLYPMIDASSSETIKQIFLDFDSNKTKYKKMGSDSRLWVETSLLRSMKGFHAQINNKTVNNQIKNFDVKVKEMKSDFEYLKFSLLNRYYIFKQSLKGILTNN